jgi:hypothetical protein
VHRLNFTLSAYSSQACTEPTREQAEKLYELASICGADHKRDNITIYNELLLKLLG